MSKLRELLQKIAGPLAIAVVSLLLFYTNYIKGTFLVGWDNLYTEFNIIGTLKVNLFSAWQEYRGLGVQDGMAHGANLFHTLYIWILSWILPLNIIRYAYHIGANFMGGLGMYFLLHRYFKKKQWIAVLGAFFYQYNIGTVQMFYAPFEVFSTHFAALPWLMWAILRFFQHPTKKHAWLFFITSLLATPQGFVPTVFIAYCAAVFSLMLAEIIKHRKTAFKKILVVIFILITTNAFWLFPFIHGAKNQGETIKNTKINQMSSEVIYERNHKRGNLLDVMILRGFMMDISETNLKGEYTLIMDTWNDHFHQPAIFGIAIIIALITLVGIYKSTKKVWHKDVSEHEFYILPLFFIGFFMLGTSIPGLALINSLIRDYVPLFGEAFRFPFTKFIIVFIFAYTIFFVKGVEYALERIHNLKLRIFVTFVSFVILFCYSFPSFNGSFFYPVEKLKIPDEYLETIEYFKTQPSDKRVMTLPQTSFWNWLYYRWGARGSGFMWYGIENAQLERPFDPWTNYNEQYLNEVLYAIQTLNPELFQNVVQKYDISYIIIDEHLQTTNRIQQRDKLEEFVEQQYPQAEKHVFKAITVYKLSPTPYVSLKHNAVKIGSEFKYEYYDQLYKDNKDYYYAKDWQEFYLLPTLFTNKTQTDLEFNFGLQQDKIQFSPHQSINLEKDPYRYVLHLDRENNLDALLPLAIIQKQDQALIAPIPITIMVGGKEYTFTTAPYALISVAGKRIKDIEVNGKAIVAGETSYAYFLTNATNTIEVTLTDGTIQNFEYTPDLSKGLEVPLGDVSGEVSANITVPIIQPEKWQTSNIFEKKTYNIDAPCIEERNRDISFYEAKDNTITLTAQNSSTCLHQFLDEVDQTLGVFMYVYNPYQKGFSLEAIVDNPLTKTNIIETKLNGKKDEKMLILPPTNRYLYENYGFHVRNVSVGNNTSVNRINELRIGYIPYTLLKSLKIIDTKQLPLGQAKTEIEYKHPAKYIYTTRLPGIEANPQLTSSLLYLSQSYNPYWRAYKVSAINWKTTMFPFLFGERIRNQVKVNNWANGWNVTDNECIKGNGCDVVIVFLPQYLQFVGYGLILVGLMGLLVYRKRKKHREIPTTWDTYVAPEAKDVPVI